MYLILNQDHRLIAADAEMLEKLGASTIYEALRLQEEGQLGVDPAAESFTLGNGKSLPCRYDTVSSLLGTLYLCRPEEKTTEEIAPATEQVEEPLLSTETAPAVEEKTTTAKEEALPEEDLIELLLQEEQQPSPKAGEEEEATFEAEEPLLPEKEEMKETPTPLSEKAEPEKEEEGELIELLLQEETQAESGEIEAPSETEESALSRVEKEEHEKTPASSEEMQPKERAGEEEENELIDLLLREEEPVSEMDKEQAESESKTEKPQLPEVSEEKLSQEEKSTANLEKEELALLSESEEKGEAKAEEETLDFLKEIDEEIGEKPVMPRETELAEISEESKAPSGVSTPPHWAVTLENFHPDLSQNAARIELTEEEYKDLLHGFIEDSRHLREELESEEESVRHRALATLKDATILLHLQPLPEFLQDLEHASDSERRSMIENFYRSLQKLEKAVPEEAPTAPKEKEEAHPILETPQEEKSPAESTPPEQPPLEEAVESSVETPTPSEEETATAMPEKTGGDFLQGVEVVPIEFSLKIASEELNLPEDLVLEFIHDFATQGHEYLPVLIEAYENGDLDKLQKTAHMLKGAASNLRIEPMVENLYELQFDQDISRAPKRIRLFAGQLMSLDHYLEQLDESQKG